MDNYNNKNYPQQPNNNYNHNPDYNSNPNYNSNFNQSYNPNQNYNANYNQSQNYNPNYNANYNQSQNYNPNYNPNQNYNSVAEKPTPKKINASSILMIVGLYIAIIGLFFTVGMAREKLHYHNMVNNGQSVYAEITDVTYSTKTSSHHTGKGGRSSGTSIYYHIYAVYEVDNQEYPIEFKTQSTKYLDDETLHIFYQDDDPTKYVVEGDSGGPIIIVVALLGVGAALAIVGFKKYRDEKDLKAMGLL